MITELKTDLEAAREALKAKGACLKKKVIVRDAFFDKGRFESGMTLRLRNLGILHPEKATVATLSSSGKEVHITKVDDFDDCYDVLNAIHGKPFIDIVWFGESYEINGCTVELRSVRDMFNYVVLSGADDKVTEAIKLMPAHEPFDSMDMLARK